MKQIDYQGFELGPIRPPSEAYSLLVRINRGCGWNKCRFCGFYRDTPFSPRPAEDIMKDIDLFSYCEHHMALMYDMKATVAYIPQGKVIGLSKIARIADMVGRRLQLQEKIGKDIADIMTEITGSQDVAVLLEAKHSCVSARGIKKTDTKTFTAELRGKFKTDATLQLYLR